VTEPRHTKPRRRSVAAAIAWAWAGGLACALRVGSGTATAAPVLREIANMTWVDVQEAIQAGYRTAIVPSGGLEQNGPHMVIGKHDCVVAWAAGRIADLLGDALVAPVVSYVPQGDYDPPTGNMVFPGTIGVPPSVFADTLEGIARSLRHAGFRKICLIADHGPSIAPQARVAAKLTAEWQQSGVQVISVDAFYADAEERAYLRRHGFTDAAIGQHASIADTSELMAVRPDAVDLTRLPSDINAFVSLGVDGDPSRAQVSFGTALMALKIDAAVRQIRAFGA
jgi:creatinine amidohydrolase